MTDTATTIAPATKIAVLKHLCNDKSFDFVSTVTRLSEEQVRDVATTHGYPREDSMRRAIGILEKQSDATADLAPKPEAPRPAAATGTRPPVAAAAPRPATTSPSSVTAPEARPVGPPDEIQVLLNTAKGHPSKRIQNAANRVFDDLDRLRALIREDQEKHAARRQAEAEKAQVRAEVERLQRQLADAKAKLRGTSSATTPTRDGGPSIAEIRAWAKANGVECPGRGRLPAAVHEAYEAAQEAVPA